MGFLLFFIYLFPDLDFKSISVTKIHRNDVVDSIIHVIVQCDSLFT